MADSKELLPASEQSSVLEVIYKLIKECPFISDKNVKFDFLDIEEDTIAVMSTPGACILSNNILGGFTGSLPFILGHKGRQSSDNRKIKTVDLLNNIGRWLGKEKVTIGDKEYVLTEYPVLSDNRKITRIEQQTVPYISDIDEKSNITYICTVKVTYCKEVD